VKIVKLNIEDYKGKWIQVGMKYGRLIRFKPSKEIIWDEKEFWMGKTEKAMAEIGIRRDHMLFVRKVAK
jgi:hypothetical protein